MQKYGYSWSYTHKKLCKKKENWKRGGGVSPLTDIPPEQKSVKKRKILTQTQPISPHEQIGKNPSHWCEKQSAAK